MRRIAISCAIILCFVICLSASADATEEPILEATYETDLAPWDSGNEEREGVAVQQGERFSVPKPESYQEYLEKADPDAPDFEKYGLDRYLVDFSPEPVEGKEDSWISPSFSYVMCGWDGEKRRPEHMARASVTAYWIKFNNGSLFDVMSDEESSNTARLFAYLTFEASQQKQYVPDKNEHYLTQSFDAETMEVVQEIEAAAGDGYEWRSIQLDVRLTEWPHGASYGWYGGDYYDIVGCDDSSETVTPEENGLSYHKWISRYVGEERTIYAFYTEDEWNEKQKAWQINVYFYVPKGYDGCVVSLYDTRLAPEGVSEGTYLFDYMNENMLSFRLK